MAEFTFPASEVRQGDLSFYAASIKVKDALEKGFYNVEKLDPREGGGYQRVLEKGRAKKIADYIAENADEPKGVFIPTSIFLTTDKPVQFSKQKQQITVTADALPFNVVDGQHRLEGFRMAAEKDARILDYEIAVNICPEMPILHQMCHFYIVNTTQKKVDEAIAQRIIAQLTEEHRLSDAPPLPKWMARLVEMGGVSRALQITEYLNNESDSPWFGKIVMANEPASKGTVNQKTFVKSVQRHVISSNNPLIHTFKDDPSRQCRAMCNYWLGIVDCIQPDEKSVFFKYTGMEIFNKFSTALFTKLASEKNFSREAVKERFKHVCDNLDGEHAGLSHKEWWRTRGPASRLNASAHSGIIGDMSRALNASGTSQDIQI